MHLDKDGDEITLQSPLLEEPITELSGEVIRGIKLRDRTHLSIYRSSHISLTGQEYKRTFCPGGWKKLLLV